MSRKKIVLEEFNLADVLADDFYSVDGLIQEIKTIEARFLDGYSQYLDNGLEITLYPVSNYDMSWDMMFEVSRMETHREAVERVRKEREEEDARNRKSEKFKELKKLYDAKKIDLIELKKILDYGQY